MRHPEKYQYLTAVEKDILKAKALLEKGYEISLVHLKNGIVEVDKTHRKLASQEIRAAVSSNRETLDEVEHCIGQINFLNAHHKIDGLSDFDDLFARLSEALKAARKLDMGADIRAASNIGDSKKQGSTARQAPISGKTRVIAGEDGDPPYSMGSFQLALANLC